MKITENRWLEVNLDLKVFQITCINFTPLRSINDSQGRLSTQIQAKIHTLVSDSAETQESVEIKAKVANLA